MLHLLKSHRLGDEFDFHLFALFEHTLRSGRSARVDVQLDILILSLLKQLINRGHETSQKKRRVIQVHKNESVWHVFANRAAYRVNRRFF